MLKARLLNFLNEQSFRNNLARVASGAALGQIIALLSLPLFSRLFLPTDFAILSTFVALHALVNSFVTARFDWIAPNAKNAEDAEKILNTAFLCMLVWCGILILPAFVFSSYILDNLRIIKTEPNLLIALFFGSVILASIRTILSSWLVYTGLLKPYAMSLLLQTLMTTSCGLVLGYYAPSLGLNSGVALVIAFCMGILVGCLTMLIGGNISSFKGLFRLRLKNNFVVLKKQYKLAITSTGVSIVNAISQNILIFVIAYLFGDTILGLYALAYRIAFAPIGFITTAMANSFWSEAVRLSKINTLELRDFYILSIKRLAIVGLGLCIVVVLGSQFLDQILGEQRWDGAGKMVLAILPLVFFSMIVGPTNHLTVYNKQKYQLISDGIAILTSVAAMFVLDWFGVDPFIAIACGMSVIAAGLVLRCRLHLYANKNHEIEG